TRSAAKPFQEQRNRSRAGWQAAQQRLRTGKPRRQVPRSRRSATPASVSLADPRVCHGCPQTRKPGRGRQAGAWRAPPPAPGPDSVSGRAARRAGAELARFPGLGTSLAGTERVSPGAVARLVLRRVASSRASPVTPGNLTAVKRREVVRAVRDPAAPASSAI